MGRSRANDRPTFADACEALESALRGSARAEILDLALRGGEPREALLRLRAGMRGNAFRTPSEPVVLEPVVRHLDALSRREGWRILHSWDPQTHRFTEDTFPVLMLDYVARAGSPARVDRRALSILLDCYFLFLLALLAIRAWDHPDPDEALDRVDALLGHLQGPRGSGHRFLADAESLLFLAIAQYQPDERSYDTLLEKARTLGEAHRLRLALVGAANLGSHLRWGYWLMYRRDPERMRADNVVDYPWLLFSLATVMREYERLHAAGAAGEERDDVVEGLLNGLTADPWAFVGEPPSCLEAHREEHALLRDRLHRHRDSLLRDFEAHRPAKAAFSPLAFHSNFLHNTFVAKVVTAVLWETTPNLPLNALFTRERPGGPVAGSPEVLARVLMDFAGEDTRRDARGSRLVHYDPDAGLRSFAATLLVLRDLESPSTVP